ncbi:MAG: DUF504 domain-containing protein [Nitrosopumilus sp.]|nr:DUF504 domain-containing protein [Nitrosopumilus sp.]MDH3736742.1 DUF504 domain-containing protein [Nitrosopumilus sp.]MDH3823654.1 DUF504 domain-containing protein [Nitrosopumilus sp.]MDH3832735.1 DUF504 domain-containing protein [Nitrosopumilus sp.]
MSRNVVKKGVIEEIFSKAIFADDSSSYKVFYRDFERIIESSLPEFLILSNNLQTIPISRIKKIKKNNTILFEKNFLGVD